MPLTRILLLWGLPKPISLHWSGLKRPEMSCPGHWAVEEHQAPGRNLCQQKKNELLSLSTLSSLLSSATPDSPSTDHLHQGQASSGKWERKKKGLIKGDWGLLEPLPNAISQTFRGSSGNFCSCILQGTAHPQDRRTGLTLSLINPLWLPESHPSGTPCPFLHSLFLRMGMCSWCSSPSQCSPHSYQSCHHAWKPSSADLSSSSSASSIVPGSDPVLSVVCATSWSHPAALLPGCQS